MVAETKQARGSYTILVKKSVLGAKVVNADREDMGTIEDLVLDTADHQIAYAILSIGGFLGMGDKHFPIPWEALAFDISEKIAVLAVDKDSLKNAPSFDKDKWPDMRDAGWDSEVYSHYGLSPTKVRGRRKAGTRKVDPNQAR